MLKKIYAKVLVSISLEKNKTLQKTFFIPLEWDEASLFQVILEGQARNWPTFAKYVVKEISTQLPDGKKCVEYMDFIAEVDECFEKIEKINRTSKVKDRTKTASMPKKDKELINEIANSMGTTPNKIIEQMMEEETENEFCKESSEMVMSPVDRKIDEIVKTAAIILGISKDELTEAALITGIEMLLSGK